MTSQTILLIFSSAILLSFYSGFVSAACQDQINQKTGVSGKNEKNSSKITIFYQIVPQWNNIATIPFTSSKKFLIFIKIIINWNFSLMTQQVRI